MPFKFDQLDAAQNVFFNRELEHIAAETFDVIYAEQMIRQLVPVSHEIEPGAESYTYRQFDQVGIAKIVSDYADDMPIVSVLGKEFTSNIKTLAVGYFYTLQEIRAAAKVNRPLDAMKAKTARDAFEQAVDRIGTNGDAASGLLGFLNQPNALSYVIPNGGGGQATWASKQPDEIVADITGITNFIFSTTKQVEKPDTLVLPTTQYDLIVSTPRSINSDTTIHDFILRTNPFLKSIVSWYKLAGAGAAGKDRMVAYTRSPAKLRLHIPLEQQPLPPQPKNLGFKVPTEGRIGGVVAMYPYSLCYGDGI